MAHDDDGHSKAPVSISVPISVPIPPMAAEGDSRARLIAAAGRMIADQGFDGVSTRDIAAAAGVNISLISYYFNGKEGLYKAVLMDFVAQAEVLIEKILTDFNKKELTKKSYRDNMSNMIRSMVEVKFRVPYFSHLMMREFLSGAPHAKETIDVFFTPFAKRIVEIMNKAQAKGIVRKDISVPTLFMSLVHATDTYFMATRCETSLSQMCLKLPDQMDEYCEQMTKIFIEGAML